MLTEASLILDVAKPLLVTAPAGGGSGGLVLVISGDAGNDIIAGSDGGAFFDHINPAVPVIVSTKPANVLTAGPDGGAWYPGPTLPPAPVIVSTKPGNDITAGPDGGAWFDYVAPPIPIIVSSQVGNSIVAGPDGGAFFHDVPGAVLVVSTDPGNLIVVGTDSGAMFNGNALMGTLALARNLDGDTGYFAHLTIVNDGTATGTWPERLRFNYNDGTKTRRTGYFNEYGEIRSIAARLNTTAARFYGQEFTADGARNLTVPILQVSDDRNLNTNLFAVYGDGKVVALGSMQTAGFQSLGNINASGDITAGGNITSGAQILGDTVHALNDADIGADLDVGGNVDVIGDVHAFNLNIDQDIVADGVVIGRAGVTSDGFISSLAETYAGTFFRANGDITTVFGDIICSVGSISAPVGNVTALNIGDKVTVSTTAPPSPVLHEVWIDI